MQNLCTAKVPMAKNPTAKNLTAKFPSVVIAYGCIHCKRWCVNVDFSCETESRNVQFFIFWLDWSRSGCIFFMLFLGGVAGQSDRTASQLRHVG